MPWFAEVDSSRYVQIVFGLKQAAQNANQVTSLFGSTSTILQALQKHMHVSSMFAGSHLNSCHLCDSKATAERQQQHAETSERNLKVLHCKHAQFALPVEAPLLRKATGGTGPQQTSESSTYVCVPRLFCRYLTLSLSAENCRCLRTTNYSMMLHILPHVPNHATWKPKHAGPAFPLLLATWVVVIACQGLCNPSVHHPYTIAIPVKSIAAHVPKTPVDRVAEHVLGCNCQPAASP